MNVKVITAFNDQSVVEGEKRRAVGDMFDASNERAAYLERLGFVGVVPPTLLPGIVQLDSTTASTDPEPASTLPPVPASAAPTTASIPVAPTADFHVAQI